MQPKTILLVERNPCRAADHRCWLERDGHVVHSVPDGLRALAGAHRLRPDVIVIAARLGGESGYQVSRILSADQRSGLNPVPGRIPIVLIADREGLGAPDSEATLLQLSEADRTLLPPVGPRDLRACIQSLTRLEPEARAALDRPFRAHALAA